MNQKVKKPHKINETKSEANNIFSNITNVAFYQDQDLDPKGRDTLKVESDWPIQKPKSITNKKRHIKKTATACLP